MKIYNTKTRKKEQFKPLNSRQVKVYFCGPTVYNYAHIGNLRTFVFEDLVVKTLVFLGYNVKTTMNITDIDDKTIRDSMKAGEKLSDFTKKYTEIFLNDIEKLGIKKADNIVLVSSLIPEMLRMINTMIKRKNAYLSSDSSIYFDIKSFKKYGELANLDLTGIKAGARVDNDEYEKDNVSDFVLWKAWKETDGDNFWEEDFEINGKKVKIKGRPGWHIECSACNMKYFGQEIDIHMGGVDLIFPHHQNEIAQTESCTKKEFSKYWLHSGHLMINGKKMSKSEGNFYTLLDIESKFQDVAKSVLYRAIRLSFINGKYRDSIDFSFSKLDANINTIKSIDSTLKLIMLYSLKTDLKNNISKDFSIYVQKFIQSYTLFLEDDLNMPEVLALFHDLLRFVNIGIRDNNFSIPEKNSILDLFKTVNEVLGIFDFSILEKNEFIPDNIIKKLEDRNNAKKNKNFDLADKIRGEIEKSGYRIVDNKDSSRVEKI